MRVPKRDRFWWIWKGKVVRGAWPINDLIPADADGPFRTQEEAKRQLTARRP